MYAYGAQSVKCAVCNHVTNVPQVQLRLQDQTTSSIQPDSQSLATPASRTTVVVENPPSLDENGNEVKITRVFDGLSLDV